MSASEEKGGASVLVWTLIGIIIGLGLGWWYGDVGVYTLIAGFSGWLVGLILAETDSSASH